MKGCMLDRRKHVCVWRLKTREQRGRYKIRRDKENVSGDGILQYIGSVIRVFENNRIVISTQPVYSRFLNSISLTIDLICFVKPFCKFPF